MLYPNWWDNPALTALLAGVGGVALKTALDGINEGARSRRERGMRLLDDQRNAIVEYMALLEDYRELYAHEDPGDEFDARASALMSRANHTLAVLDLLAPVEICDLASQAFYVGHLEYNDPRRVAAIEALVDAARHHLGVGGTWRQYPSEGQPSTVDDGA